MINAAENSISNIFSIEQNSFRFNLIQIFPPFENPGSTHTLLTPLDLVKCRLQVDQAKYKNLFTGFKVTFAEDGSRGLVKGWAPTLFGYSAQGLFKFGLYEYFKCLYTDIIGDEAAFLYRTSLYLAASASAEFFADIALSPMEAAKVKVCA